MAFQNQLGISSIYDYYTVPVVDFRHRFTVIKFMYDTPVPIGRIHSFHSNV